MAALTYSAQQRINPLAKSHVVAAGFAEVSITRCRRWKSEGFCEQRFFGWRCAHRVNSPSIQGQFDHKGAHFAMPNFASKCCYMTSLWQLSRDSFTFAQGVLESSLWICRRVGVAQIWSEPR